MPEKPSGDEKNIFSRLARSAGDLLGGNRSKEGSVGTPVSEVPNGTEIHLAPGRAVQFGFRYGQQSGETVLLSGENVKENPLFQATATAKGCEISGLNKDFSTRILVQPEDFSQGVPLKESVVVENQAYIYVTGSQRTERMQRLEVKKSKTGGYTLTRVDTER